MIQSVLFSFHNHNKNNDLWHPLYWNCGQNLFLLKSQLALTYSNFTIETLEQGVKNAQSFNRYYLSFFKRKILLKANYIVTRIMQSAYGFVYALLYLVFIWMTLSMPNRIYTFNSFLMDVSTNQCSANQWTGFYIIETSIMKDLNTLIRLGGIIFSRPSWNFLSFAKWCETIFGLDFNAFLENLLDRSVNVIKTRTNTWFFH